MSQAAKRKMRHVRTMAAVAAAEKKKTEEGGASTSALPKAGEKRGRPTPTPEKEGSGSAGKEEREMKKRKTYQEALSGNLAIWIRKEVNGEKVDLDDKEVDGLFALVDGMCKLTSRENKGRVRVDHFGMKQGQVVILLKDAWSKMVVEGALANLPTGMIKSDKGEMKTYRRHTVYIPSRRGEPTEWMEWLREAYSEELQKDDIKVYVVIKKEGGNTIAMGLSEKAEEEFRKDDMHVYVGAGKYEMVNWEERQKNKEDEEAKRNNDAREENQGTSHKNG
jgi:hypothetical protein